MVSCPNSDQPWSLIWSLVTNLNGLAGKFTQLQLVTCYYLYRFLYLNLLIGNMTYAGCSQMNACAGAVFEGKLDHPGVTVDCSATGSCVNGIFSTVSFHLCTKTADCGVLKSSFGPLLLVFCCDALRYKHVVPFLSLTLTLCFCPYDTRFIK